MAQISNLEAYYRRKKRKRKIIIRRAVVIALLLILVLGGVGIFRIFRGGMSNSELEKLKSLEMPEYVDTQLIHHHTTARTGIKLDGVKNIVIHYVGNPKSTAQNNRDYFNKATTTVSSHFVVGLEGEVIQCLPIWEKSAASNDRNKDTISIEVCHPDESGKFNEATYNTLKKLTAYLLFNLGLDETDVIRHYDITGKLCPLYFAEHEDEWIAFKKDVGEVLNEYKGK